MHSTFKIVNSYLVLAPIDQQKTNLNNENPQKHQNDKSTASLRPCKKKKPIYFLVLRQLGQTLQLLNIETKEHDIPFLDDIFFTLGSQLQ